MGGDRAEGEADQGRVGLERLWVPWRMTYVATAAAPSGGCIFCEKPQEERDEENYILARRERCFVILNAFPYNTGHLMIVPYSHLSMLGELSHAELGDLMVLTRDCEEALIEAFRPEGFNIGMNLGRIAGAGIRDHLHIHVVPRWNGDTNFMPVVGATKVIPEALADTYRRLREVLNKQ